MSSISDWLGSTPPLADWLVGVDRATDTARVIAAKPTSITVRRAGAALDAQTVRLEVSSMPTQVSGANATSTNLQTVVLGYKSHPTIADTDLQRGDRFFAGGQMYEVVQVLADVPDRLLAIAEATE